MAVARRERKFQTSSILLLTIFLPKNTTQCRRAPNPGVECAPSDHPRLLLVSKDQTSLQSGPSATMATTLSAANASLGRHSEPGVECVHQTPALPVRPVLTDGSLKLSGERTLEGHGRSPSRAPHAADYLPGFLDVQACTWGGGRKGTGFRRVSQETKVDSFARPKAKRCTKDSSFQYR